MKNTLITEIREHKRVTDFVENELLESILEISKLISVAIHASKKVYLFGNGGSASDAQHIAAEFTGRFVKERKGLPAIALTTDTSALTAIGNDYGFENIFSRQVEALAKEGDILIGISTSGKSLNVVRAIEMGLNIGCKTITFTGNNGCKLINMSDYNINIESTVTARIQEMHILIGHLICVVIDELNQ
jgi:D-sedoheptulose 7-phosphate isomerase